MNTSLDLAFFAVLARSSSLAAAAQELGVSAPAVSRRLAALELRLGVTLLHRTTRRISLSAEGERYLEEGEVILRDIERLERTLRGSREEPRGLLRINATFGFGRHHLAPALADFSVAYPDIEAILQLTDRPLDLAEHAIDLGIRFGAPADGRLVVRPLANNRRLLCAAPAYVAAHGEPATPGDLPHHDCIVIRENTAAFNRWQLTRLVAGAVAETQTVKVKGRLSSNHGEVAVDWALAGRGVVLRSEWDVSGHLRQGELQRLLPDWVGMGADICAVYAPAQRLVPKVRVLVDFLAERFAALRQGGEGGGGW